MAYLIHYYNGSPITHFELGDRLTIGRGEGQDLQIDDVTVSSAHAVVERTASGDYRIRDLDSTNGVLFQGRKVQERDLTPGDCLLVGTHELEYVDELPEPLLRTARIKKSWLPGVYYTVDQ